MPINLDNIKPIADVIISLNNFSYFIEISFAHNPNNLLQELTSLASNPGFKLYSELITKNQFFLFVPESWDRFQIAEAIASCYEDQHNLKVRRLIPDPQKSNKTPSKKISSFLLMSD